VSEFVQAPREEVFALSSDFARSPEFIRGIDKVQMLHEGTTAIGVGVGTRFRETRIIFGREATEEMEVTAFDPPNRYVLEADSHGAHYVSELSFQEEAGGTRVTLTFEAHPQTFFAKVMSFLTKPMQKSMLKMCAQDLADLKKKAEGTA
jgi:carbon monoxide dehydrogenase subunit G